MDKPKAGMKPLLCPDCKIRPEALVCTHGWIVRCRSMPWECSGPIQAIGHTLTEAVKDWNEKVRKAKHGKH